MEQSYSQAAGLNINQAQWYSQPETGLIFLLQWIHGATNPILLVFIGQPVRFLLTSSTTVFIVLMPMLSRNRGMRQSLSWMLLHFRFLMTEDLATIIRARWWELCDKRQNGQPNMFWSSPTDSRHTRHILTAISIYGAKFLLLDIRSKWTLSAHQRQLHTQRQE